MDRKSSRFLVRRLAYLRFHRASVPYGIKRLDAVPESVDICTQNIGTLSEVDIFAKASRLKCHTSIRSCLEVPFAAISQQRTRKAHSQELALVYPQKKKHVDPETTTAGTQSRAHVHRRNTKSTSFTDFKRARIREVIESLTIHPNTIDWLCWIEVNLNVSSVCY